MVVNNQNRTQNWFSASKAIFEMENLTEHDIGQPPPLTEAGACPGGGRGNRLTRRPSAQ
ncbi:hypothetical protein Tfer_0905 [Thermincola ferriacetica]|uniref:Uncharacterized protein n=1 Tax=Thermincola ferriacetica TaxID=281456 RepID=A0A0L6W486_9FIRM|nr:hypothetical protein [Thermincola ferriacetica]KNZ70345.1 hypothetical protein Tfer_0905 [Thermincola ferriacetica]